MACTWKTRARKVSSGRELGHQGSCSCVGAGCAHHSDVAENGGHPTGHVPFRNKNSASTWAMLGSAAAQRDAFARCYAAAGEMDASCSHDFGARRPPTPAGASSTAPRDSYSVLVARVLSPETLKRRLCATIGCCALRQPGHGQAQQRDLRRRLKPVPAGWWQARAASAASSRLAAARSMPRSHCHPSRTRRKRQFGAPSAMSSSVFAALSYESSNSRHTTFVLKRGY